MKAPYLKIQVSFCCLVDFIVFICHKEFGLKTGAQGIFMSNPKWAIKAITDSNKIPSNITLMSLTFMES